MVEKVNCWASDFYSRLMMVDNERVKTPHNRSDLADLIARTISALDNARLPLDLPGSMQLNDARKRLRTQLAARILPHLRTDGLPTVTVLGGSSGAGKSTIFNSLLGEDISPASVIRPTTRTPVISVHPKDTKVMEDHAIAEMGRVVVTDKAIPGLILVDAPDLDSVDANNREISRRLLDAADFWLFVTTASRYGDALAWQTLVDANERGMSTAVVLNRVSLEALPKIRADLTERLDAVDMGEVPLLIVPDAGPRDSRLDPDDVTEIRDWLHVIASTRVGEVLVEKMSDAMLPDLRRQLIELSEAVEMQANSVQSLADRAKAEAEQPMSKLASNARSGRYGQGAPTTSWLTFASTGGVLDSLVAGEKPRVSDGRKKPQRDAAAKTVFEGVRGAIEVGFSQAVVTLQGKIDKSWREDMVNTEEYRDEAAKRIDTSEITKDVVEQWLEDLAKAVAAVPENPWFTREGTAALLGSAAGGVNGAETALRTVGLGEALRPARESLAVRLEDGISRVVDAYTSVLDEIPVGNGRQLRLRASEYRDRV